MSSSGKASSGYVFSSGSGATGTSFSSGRGNNRGIDAECIEDAFSYGKGDIAEVIVKEHVVRVRIDKSDFDKNRRHFCASEDNEPGAGFYSEIYKTDPLKLFVYIFRHLQLMPDLS